MELWIALATLALSIISSLVLIQMWAVKTAKAAGIREERERVMTAQLDAAHSKIREVVMPEIDTLKDTVKELTIRAEGTAGTMAEMKQDVKTVLATVQQLAVSLATLGASNGNGH